MVQIEALPSARRDRAARIARGIRHDHSGDVEVRVADSTSALRFLVLPLRPGASDDYTQEQLAALVTRDAMIGVVTVNANERSDAK